MSNALAIAAVTATLRNLMVRAVDVPNQNITTKPLDKVRTGNASPDQLNIFLYQTVLNAAWRNMDIPRNSRPGETGHPPLALNLHYLITAYGNGDDETLSHQWLGKAMSVLHDHPVLGAQEIQDALKKSDLEAQIERVRITPQPMSLEEMSKLWTTFQTQYRISAAYQVEVVLIESTRPARTPLPVLTRGKDDSGVRAQADLIPPFPTILDVLPPNEQPSARLNETLTIDGFHLDGDNVAVRFTSSRLATPRIEPAAGTAERVTVTVPNDPANMPAGFYTVAVRTHKAGEPEPRFTNEWPLQIAPAISNISPAPTAPAGNVTFILACSPQILPAQRASLLFGDREILRRPHSEATNLLTFDVKAAAKGPYFLRVRVDGVDSLIIDRRVVPPRFDPGQRITIT
jgi:hypothetical protein